MPTPRSANWLMANRLADDRLAEVLVELRTQGVTLDQIARRLHAEYGIDTTRQTVHSWCRQLTADHDGTKAAS